MRKGGYVYILTNIKNRVLYTGVTNDLIRRIGEHREKKYDGFTKSYKATKLVWYESHASIESAITKEKQIKSGSRQAKIELIKAMNPKWTDLYESIIG